MSNQTRIIANSLIVIGVILSIAFAGLAFVGDTPTQHASHSIHSHYRA